MNIFGTDTGVEIYIGLVLLINRIVAGFFTPIMDELKISKKWLMYIAWVLAAWLLFVTDLNLFTAIIPDPVVGKLLSAVAVGGGASVLHDVSDNEPAKHYENSSRNPTIHDATDR